MLAIKSSPSGVYGPSDGFQQAAKRARLLRRDRHFLAAARLRDGAEKDRGSLALAGHLCFNAARRVRRNQPLDDPGAGRIDPLDAGNVQCDGMDIGASFQRPQVGVHIVHAPRRPVAGEGANKHAILLPGFDRGVVLCIRGPACFQRSIGQHGVEFYPVGSGLSL